MVVGPLGVVERMDHLVPQNELGRLVDLVARAVEDPNRHVGIVSDGRAGGNAGVRVAPVIGRRERVVRVAFGDDRDRLIGGLDTPPEFFPGWGIVQHEHIELELTAQCVEVTRSAFTSDRNAQQVPEMGQRIDFPMRRRVTEGHAIRPSFASPRRQVERDRVRRSGQSVLPDPPLVQRVRRAIRDALPHDAPKVADVAKALGLGPRTLHRRLAAEDRSFGEVLDSTRHRVAVGCLADALRRALGSPVGRRG